MSQSSPDFPRPVKTRMNVTTVFDRERRLRTHQVTGVINLPEFGGFLRHIYSSPDFNADLNALWDLRQADFSRIMPEDVRAMMHVVVTNWGHPGKCRSAILVASQVEYDVVRIYISQFGGAAPCTIKVFLDMREALPWFVGREEASRVEEAQSESSLGIDPR